jgi:hypothetical protein
LFVYQEEGPVRQSNFAYSSSTDADAASAPVIGIFADRPHVRDLIRDDALAAGLRVARTGELAELRDADERPLGDVVLVDCPAMDGAVLAALAQLDCRAAASGTPLIVATTGASLDEVFACLDQSRPELLVNPSRADWVIALGRVLAQMSKLRVEELHDEDRLMLLRLTEQVGQIAQRLERLDGTHELGGEEDSVFGFHSPKRTFSGGEEPGDRLRATRPPLPEPRLVRKIIRQRQLRGKFFDPELFADPAWDMLLDLTAARAEHRRVSVTSLCIASGVPPTTALRWISHMTEQGLFERVEDESDRRRAFIGLTDKAADLMARFFAELGTGAGKMV